MSKQLLKLDVSGLFEAKVGEHGLREPALEGLRERAEAAAAAVQADRGTGWLRWMDLPYRDDVADAIAASAKAKEGLFDDVVVLGIGGSALGNTAVQSALRHPYWNSLPKGGRGGFPRMHVVDNVDPARLAGLVDVLDPAKTLFNVISKSGSTAETMSQFMLFRDLVEKAVGAEKVKEHFVCTTDAEKGILRPIVRDEGFESFVVPEGVGGRFSVLSEVGLFSTAIAGVDIRAMLAGAARADEATKKPALGDNPAAMLAAALYLCDTELGAHVHVMMPYSHALRDMADWFRQIWAESLGKAVDTSGKTVNVGPTPAKALGATDQHSQIQLYTEGPFDKVVMMLAVEDFGGDVTIPESYGETGGIAYLGGHTFGELLNAEMRATEIALSDAGRPNLRIDFPAVTPETVGAFFYLFEMTTAIAGRLYDIDAFNQPGVEAGKIATYALMGRDGYEEKRAEIESAPRSPEKHILGV